MNKYRTHLCSELNISDLKEDVILSGWVDTIRDHGNLIFIDLDNANPISLSNIKARILYGDLT